MRDIFVEIWESIRRNKLRTCLTGFAVAWGIFMLITLLGAGNGIMNIFDSNSEGLDVNTMRVYGNTTSKPYGGFKQGRYIELDEYDLKLTASPVFADHIDEIIQIIRSREHFICVRRRILACSGRSILALGFFLGIFFRDLCIYISHIRLIRAFAILALPVRCIRLIQILLRCLSSLFRF